MRQDAVGVVGEQRQQLELFRRQADVVVAAHDAPAIVVDGEIRHLHASYFRRIGFEHAPEGDADPRQQLFGAERLGHVIVCANVKRVDLVRLAATRRQHHDRSFRLLSNPPADLGSFEVRQPEVEDDQVRPVFVDRFHRLGAGANHVDLVTARPQQRRHRPLNRDVVVDEENSCRAIHRTSAGTAIVKRAPPSAQFSAEIWSAFDREDAAGDGEPHSRARSSLFRVDTTIEPFEHVRQISR